MRKFFQNTLYSLSGKVIGAGALVLLDILIARMLNPDGYAEWVYFFSFLTVLFYLGWLGINASSKVIISRCQGEGEIIDCLLSSFTIRTGASIIISLIFMFFLFCFLDELGYPEKYPCLKQLVMYSGALIFLNSFTEYYKEIFMGLGKFDRLFQLTTLEYTGYFLYAFIFLNISRNVSVVAIAYCVSGFAIFAFGLFVLIHDCKLNHLSGKKKISYKPYILEIAKYAVPMLLVGMGVVVLIEIDTFMLGILSTKNEVAIYNIGKSLNSKVAHVNYSIAVGSMTSFGVILNSEYIKKRKQFIKLSSINFSVSILIALILFFIAPALIKLLYGDAYYAAGKVTRYLTLYYILFALSTFYSTFLDFRKQAKKRAIMYPVVIVLDILLNIVLIPRYGAVGAAVATTFSMAPYVIVSILVTEKEWRKLRLKGDAENE